MINKKRLVALTQKIIRINSVNPPGNEWELANFIKKDLQSLGLAVKTYTFARMRPNIVATLKGTLPPKIAARESILLSPHMDTVPVGSGWRFNPFGGQIHQGRIYGRGATDDKGNLACSLEVMRSLVGDKVRFKKDIILAITVDEETGSHKGIVPLLDKKILKPKTALILDSDAFNTIVAQKGLIHCRIKIFGKKAHGAYNWRGINAIELSSRIINRLKGHRFRCRRHPLLRPPTVNIGTIKGGDKVNIVADFCEFAVDLRYLPGMDPQKILKEIKRIIEGEAKKYKIEIDDIQYPYEINSRHPLVQTFVKASRSMGIKAHLKGSEGATVISFFKKKRIPAAATGFGAVGTAHITDEYVVIDDLCRGAKVLEQFLKEYDRL